jgi:hypothetical protein
LLEATLNVQENMSESHNGKAQIQPEHPKRTGRFTGQRLKLIRPDTYRRVVELLAEPREQVPYDHIARLLHVSEHTVKAVEQREAVSIAERKENLLRKSLRLADKAIDRIEDQIDDANITQATVAFGVATDKAVLLSGGPASRILNIDISASVDIHARYDELCRKIAQRAQAREVQPQHPQLMPPNSETISDHTAGNG